MPRTHGYSAKGLRCFGTHDWHAKSRINADVFHAWMTQDLLPKLPSRTVIVMDNASFHKRNDTIKAIADHGCQLEWLPAYSPDLNPIEHKWAEVKAIRRRERCSIDELFMEHVEHA
ncbi:transposase [Xenorhabdus bovienii]|uniref:Transposase n=1 Tax=Xenorhabdus bovienii TaxID=40576 RepID=A0AAJ1JE38_XENBV|nr:transposase [Xenorhabdus bovienii]MDE1479733.1 transposase [Xenorhabdus bovienii]MDE1491150.1 transposase [Xenorhabdus bovienii]MDE9511552.1 transposase [Xenorhabdus bovienii]MDE9523181.1 transposase [Xenorhabdus bovienii]